MVTKLDPFADLSTVGWRMLQTHRRKNMKALLFALALACCLPGCRKKGAEAGAEQGGLWLAGQRGLLASVQPDGTLTDFELGIGDDLLDLACRGSDSVFVVGERGTFLRTFDGGAEWETIELGTRGALRSVAAASREYVVVAGDEGLFLSADSGTTWSTLATGAFSSVAVDLSGDVVMALDLSGTVWREDRSASLRPVFAGAGAEALAMSPGGERAVVLMPGNVLWVTSDGGAHWQPVELGGTYTLRSAQLTPDGSIVAVGDDGVVLQLGAGHQVTVQRPLRSRLAAVHLGAAGTGYAAGAEGKLVQTLDGGATWTALGKGTPSQVLAIDQALPAAH